MTLPPSRAARSAAVVLLATLILPRLAASPSLEELFRERTRSIVAVEFFVETEIDRRPSTVVGMVADDRGLVVLLDTAIPGWLPPGQLKDFKVYPPATRDGASATYLGQDYFTGWHFLRVAQEGIAGLVPCTDHPVAVPALGDPVWGIGVMGKEFDFQPYLMIGHVAAIQDLPQRVGFAANDLASPGSPVFARAGGFVGWAGNPLPQDRVLFLENDRYNVGLQNANGSANFMLAAEVLPHLGNVPPAPTGQAVPWLGVVGLQPVDREVAEFLQIENRSAVVVSDIVRDGPAAKAGVEKRDVIVAVDGSPFPRFSPARVVTTFFEREILRRKPGEVMRIGVVRGSERREFAVTVGTQPTPLKEARRLYFERLGITLREFVLFDSISRRLADGEERGVIANFVKPNSPAATAGLRSGDLIREIDGQAVTTYETAVERTTAIEADTARPEFVLLIGRGAETAVIRVPLR